MFSVPVSKFPLLLLLLLFRYTLNTTAAAVTANYAAEATTRIQAICTALLALLVATILTSLLSLGPSQLGFLLQLHPRDQY